MINCRHKNSITKRKCVYDGKYYSRIEERKVCLECGHIEILNSEEIEKPIVPYQPMIKLW